MSDNQILFTEHLKRCKICSTQLGYVLAHFMEELEKSHV